MKAKPRMKITADLAKSLGLSSGLVGEKLTLTAIRKTQEASLADLEAEKAQIEAAIAVIDKFLAQRGRVFRADPKYKM